MKRCGGRRAGWTVEIWGSRRGMWNRTSGAGVPGAVPRRVTLTVICLLLAIASPAAGKGLVAVSARGADGCHDVTALVGDDDIGWLIGDLRRTGEPAPGEAAFVELRISYGDPATGSVTHTQRILYAPSLGRVAYDRPWRWVPVDRRGRVIADRLVRRVRLRPPAEMPAGTHVEWPPPATARVVEVYSPAPREAQSAGPRWWTLGAVAVTLLAGAALVAGRRRGASPSRRAQAA